MAKPAAEPAQRRGVGVPLTLLVAFLIALGGVAAVAWIAPPDQPGMTPVAVSLEIDRPEAPQPAAVPAPPPQAATPPEAQPPKDQPPKDQPAQAAPVGPEPAPEIAKLQPGQLPRLVYARPFKADDTRPRIAIVLTGLGLASNATDTAIKSLPGQVTLAFVPYANDLDAWVRLARAKGHEVLLSLPMEPANYPIFDPGPKALLTSQSNAENLANLSWTLGRAKGYVGLIDFMGSQFTAVPKALRPVLQAINKNGLVFVDRQSAVRSVVPEVAREVGLPVAIGTREIDEQASRAGIDDKLRELERIAKQSGHAVGIASLYPVTLERISAWASTIERRGIALAPITAITGRTAGASNG